MAGRDRAVTQTAVRLHENLILLTKSYQNARRLPSFNAAVIELLEHSLTEWAMTLPEAVDYRDEPVIVVSAQ